MAADLASLLRKTHITSHQDVLKAANADLKKSKTDGRAQHARAIALLKLDRYEDAVRAFDEAGSQLREAAPLEYAYALYKAGQLQKAEEVAKSAQDGGRGLRHVLAQISYRLEKFDTVADTYKQLADGSGAANAEASDLRINSAAVDAQLEWQGKGHLVQRKQPTREDLEAFESAYNAACGAIARGELAKGEILLRRARDLCLAVEDLSEDEKQAELVPIVTQMVYVLIRLGKTEDALKLATETGVVESTDEATQWIARVNKLVASGDSNSFLIHRQFHSGEALKGTDKPFQYQTDVLQQDAIITDLLASKHDGVVKSTASALSETTSPTTSSSHNMFSVLNATAHAKGQTNKAGLKAVLPLLDQRPNDVGLLLTVVQLYLLTNNPGSAISLLESFFSRLEQSKSSSDLDVRFAPGLIGVLVSLYSAQSRKASIKSELSRAASYWRSRRKEDSSIALPIALLRTAGTSLLESGTEEDAKVAVDIFSDLHSHDPNDRASTAGLVAALALADPSSIPEEALKSLTPASRLISDIDAAALEDAGIPTSTALTTQTKSATSKKRAAPISTVSKDGVKKVRLSKKRMPKDFVEGKEMDKERWLPLRDRSYYRPKGKKGKKRDQGGTQGGAVDESLGKTAAPVAQSGGSGGGGGKNKAKKKKGGR